MHESAAQMQGSLIRLFDMRRRRFLTALPASAALQAQTAEWRDPFVKAWRDSFLAHWRDTREYTLAILDAMPAEHFTSKPDAAQRTFGEQMVHLAQANNAYFQGLRLAPAPEGKADPADKASVRNFVNASFDFIARTLDRMQENDWTRKDVKLFQRGQVHSTVDICMRAYMHTAHHRGQVVTYLRVKGIKPPAWKFEPTAG
jgi:uncharacterized damage-inducible protein DinB